MGESSIYIFPVVNYQDQDGDSLILNIADQAVVPYPVTPETLLFAMKRLAPLSWSVGWSQTLTKETDYSLLDRTGKLSDLALSFAADFNGPNQAGAPALRALSQVRGARALPFP